MKSALSEAKVEIVRCCDAAHAEDDASHWIPVCQVQDIWLNTGVAALVGERQVALFRTEEAVYALDNLDPFSGAQVIARGILGDVQAEPVVASPVYKQHFSLRTGRCLEFPDVSLAVWPLRICNDQIWIATLPQLSAED